MELCESVLLATKQIQKVHLNHYQRVQAMVYNVSTEDRGSVAKELAGQVKQYVLIRFELVKRMEGERLVKIIVRLSLRGVTCKVAHIRDG